jgi:hypothetical protein
MCNTKLVDASFDKLSTNGSQVYLMFKNRAAVEFRGTLANNIVQVAIGAPPSDLIKARRSKATFQ